jgi:CelD/BcsL family acetyltransferase involved in cellulose biosynthesis
VTVELADDPAAFRTLDWTELVMADPAGTFFHTPSYMKLWWEELGRGSLLLALVRDGEDVAAACAFEILEGTLRFVGGFDVTDYMGPVGLPGAQESAAKELLSAVASDSRWERADLRGLALDSPWHDALRSAAASLGLDAGLGEDDVAPILPLPDSYDEYLRMLSSKRRHEIRRKQRRLAQEAGGRYEIRAATEDTLRRDFDRFIEMHRSSPGPKGKFMHAGMEIFFRRLGEEFLPPHVFHLVFLEMGGIQAAGAIGFAFKNIFSLYNSAFDRAYARLSPGMVLISDLIARAIELGRDTFDLLKGDIEYKYRFGATPRPIGKLILTR